MQLTPNYNLKKPEETDPIDILDLNDNADIIDAEFKKRPVASGGDVSEMTVKTLETTTTEFPVPVAGESTKTFLGKVKKFFEDTKNWMTGVCLIGQIVNNCVTNNAKLPLSAAQGKVLMDLYTVLNTKIDNFDEGLKIRYGSAMVSFNSASGIINHNLNFTSIDSYILLAALNDSSIFGIVGSVVNRSGNSTYIQMHFVYDNQLSAASGNRRISYIAIGK